MRETFIANRGVLKQTIGTNHDPTGDVINEHTDVNVLEFPDTTISITTAFPPLVTIISPLVSNYFVTRLSLNPSASLSF
jgi:hypothetical protein